SIPIGAEDHIGWLRCRKSLYASLTPSKRGAGAGQNRSREASVFGARTDQCPRVGGCERPFMSAPRRSPDYRKREKSGFRLPRKAATPSWNSSLSNPFAS